MEEGIIQEAHRGMDLIQISSANSFRTMRPWRRRGGPSHWDLARRQASRVLTTLCRRGAAATGSITNA